MISALCSLLSHVHSCSTPRSRSHSRAQVLTRTPLLPSPCPRPRRLLSDPPLCLLQPCPSTVSNGLTECPQRQTTCRHPRTKVNPKSTKRKDVKPAYKQRMALGSPERESKEMDGMGTKEDGRAKTEQVIGRTYDLVYSTYSSRYIPLYVVSKQWQFAVGTGLAAAPPTTNLNDRLHAQR